VATVLIIGVSRPKDDRVIHGGAVVLSGRQELWAKVGDGVKG
jgi:hypothetical protein